ncbi:hypothetical protein P691DRAFT_791729 [Macrolepiota fuliginosa MF-IS2]|uniref:Uncharacterized protein n=1 Tax=Macrolepiota fuliginosa MF-IS2 TaxID=1400762 RepID=A0A9P6BX16_9AGAR|nr:hypothetical protein P691DRAFT_791729 [Macrolepiota fuliginosa MF-IS2]
MSDTGLEITLDRSRPRPNSLIFPATRSGIPDHPLLQLKIAAAGQFWPICSPLGGSNPRLGKMGPCPPLKITPILAVREIGLHQHREDIRLRIQVFDWTSETEALEYEVPPYEALSWTKIKVHMQKITFAEDLEVAHEILKMRRKYQGLAGARKESLGLLKRDTGYLIARCPWEGWDGRRDNEIVAITSRPGSLKYKSSLKGLIGDSGESEEENGDDDDEDEDGYESGEEDGDEDEGEEWEEEGHGVDIPGINVCDAFAAVSPFGGEMRNIRSFEGMLSDSKKRQQAKRVKKLKQYLYVGTDYEDFVRSLGFRQVQHLIRGAHPSPLGVGSTLVRRLPPPNSCSEMWTRMGEVVELLREYRRSEVRRDCVPKSLGGEVEEERGGSPNRSPGPEFNRKGIGALGFNKARAQVSDLKHLRSRQGTPAKEENLIFGQVTMRSGHAALVREFMPLWVHHRTAEIRQWLVRSHRGPINPKHPRKLYEAVRKHRSTFLVLRSRRQAE